ncbi:MAG: ATP-binding cassette domain-containing protein [Ignavibacteriales bacterium]|nr:ATP-binding cassette domain-containing protein [Ignavibacteriales bacterium]
MFQNLLAHNVVLNNVSLTVEENENLVVFGQSGTGKSVLLKMYG